MLGVCADRWFCMTHSNLQCHIIDIIEVPWHSTTLHSNTVVPTDINSIGHHHSAKPLVIYQFTTLITVSNFTITHARVWHFFDYRYQQCSTSLLSLHGSREVPLSHQTVMVIILHSYTRTFRNFVSRKNTVRLKWQLGSVAYYYRRICKMPICGDGWQCFDVQKHQLIIEHKYSCIYTELTEVHVSVMTFQQPHQWVNFALVEPRTTFNRSLL